MAQYKDKITPQETKRFNRLARALFGIESAGGHWRSIGPKLPSGRAYGISQVMDFNIPSWTQKYYGKKLTPSQYLNDKEAQIAVTNGVMTEYWQMTAKYSSDPNVRVRMVAAGWFGGPGNMKNYDSTRVSDGYVSMRTYTTRVLNDYRKLSGSPTVPPVLAQAPDREAEPTTETRESDPDLLPVPAERPPTRSSTPDKYKKVPPPPPAPEKEEERYPPGTMPDPNGFPVPVPNPPEDEEGIPIPIEVPELSMRMPAIPLTYYFERKKQYATDLKSTSNPWQ